MFVTPFDDDDDGSDCCCCCRWRWNGWMDEWRQRRRGVCTYLPSLTAQSIFIIIGYINNNNNNSTTSQETRKRMSAAASPFVVVLKRRREEKRERLLLLLLLHRSTPTSIIRRWSTTNIDGIEKWLPYGTVRVARWTNEEEELK